MLGSSRRVSVFAFSGPVDLRKGYDGLGALVSGELGQDPLSGDLFLFVNRRRTMAKVLLWDGTGLCIFSKRLEQGRFACLWKAPGTDSIRLTNNELQLFLEGSQLIGRMRISPPENLPKPLARQADL
jgi:transposase